MKYIDTYTQNKKKGPEGGTAWEWPLFILSVNIASSLCCEYVAQKISVLEI